MSASKGLAEGCSVVIGAMSDADARDPLPVDDAVDEVALTGLSGMIEASASRSLAVKLRPLCNRLGRAAFCCWARDDPRRRKGGAATGEAGVSTIAEGRDGSSVMVVLLNELDEEVVVMVVSSDMVLDNILSGVVLALFCRLVDNRTARPTSSCTRWWPSSFS